MTSFEKGVCLAGADGRSVLLIRFMMATISGWWRLYFNYFLYVGDSRNILRFCSDRMLFCALTNLESRLLNYSTGERR
jgi:hypothetical protein